MKNITTKNASTVVTSQTASASAFKLRTGWSYEDALELSKEVDGEHDNEQTLRWDLKSLWHALINVVRNLSTGSICSLSHN